MDKNTWENYPVGTYVLVTWEDDDRESYSVVRGKGDSGGASAGNVGVYIGSHWDEIFSWAGASFEVLYLPPVRLEGAQVRITEDYYGLPAGTEGLAEKYDTDAYFVSFYVYPEQSFWVREDAVEPVVEG